MTEIPTDKKIAKVRVYEKDRLIPGQYVIHGLDFIGEDGAILASVKSRNNPRAGCVRTILIDPDEKIVGVH